MRNTWAALALASGLIDASNAINLRKRTDGKPPKVVQHDIGRRHVSDPVGHDRSRRLQRRQETVSVPLDNEQTLYFMNLSIGTPAQDFRMHIDTGSSDLWVNVDDSRICESRGDPCDISGTFSPNDSSTYNYVNSDFQISYLDGSGSAGDYGSDLVQFGDIELEDQQFGIGYRSTSQQGILGIGYRLNEVQVVYFGDDPYPNIPANLVDHDLINTNAYSLWLNDLDASTGSILFGGVNTGKYTGQLQTLPIIPEQGDYREFVIALTAVGANGDVGSIAPDTAIPALLDSGSSLAYLPDNIVSTIYDAVGAQYDSQQELAVVDCDLRSSDATIDFTFSGVTIRVGMDELVITAVRSYTREYCIFGILPKGEDPPVLGDTFLRSAYVVYDMNNNEISLAQTSFNSTDTDIEEITDDGPPDATVVESAVTSLAVQTGGARINGGDGLGDFTGSESTSSEDSFARPTAAVGYNVALLGAAGAGLAFAW